MDNLESRNNQKKDNSISINDEVQKLFKKNEGKIMQNDFIALKNKYNNDELLTKIHETYIEKYNDITKKAKKFAKLIREKYNNTQYPFHILLEKALKYKVKYGITDNEFDVFQRIYETELVGIKSNDVMQPNTNMMNLLGSHVVNIQGFKNFTNSDTDYKILQDIIRLHATGKPLHSQIIIQSLSYRDLDIPAISGKYNDSIHNPTNNIHPVIAALFLPKFDLVDKHFLISNIANIVKTRYNNEKFTTTADIELFYALIKDPNDIICDNKSTLQDLYNRALLQNQLWNSVLHLRNGQYYNSTFRDFIASVDICKLNKYDTPDLVYGRYDGVIIKRLLSAFSFRPTIVATTPIYASNVNPYQQNIKPVVTYVPMINLKLSAFDTTIVDLNDALHQEQYFLENNSVVVKNTALIYSREVLIFFVDRRAQVIDVKSINTPISILNHPSALYGFERINDTEVNAEMSLNIRNDEYRLRSVVLSEVNNLATNANIVIGSSTILIDYDSTLPTFLHYDPTRVVSRRVTNDNNVAPFDPIISIPHASTDSNVVDYSTISRKRGIIFIYQLHNDNSKGVISY
jgi:hypothetical protein